MIQPMVIAQMWATPVAQQQIDLPEPTREALIEVLKRKDSPSTGQDLSITTSLSKESTSGKGAAIATLTIGGQRLAIGFAGLVDGPLDALGARDAALVRAREQGYLGA